MPTYVCLVCGHELYREVPSEGLIQCTNYKCRSYFVLPKEKYESIIEGLKTVIEDDTPFLDILDGVIEVLRANGIRGQPLRTLAMASFLVKEAERRKKIASRGQL